MPHITVVMPLYNKEKDVLRALHSVLAQTFHDLEIVVVNDGSTDNGPDLVRAIRDSRIRVLDQANQGVSAARNRGIQEAKADLIAFLDADDEWLPDYLKTILKLVSKFPEASVYATGYMFKQSGGHERRAFIRGLPESFSDGILVNYFAVAVQSDPPLWTSAVAVRKEALQAFGGFPVGVVAGEDLLTWARLAVRYKIAYSLFPKATFYAPERMEDRPSRRPQVPDLVAMGLLELLNDSALPAGAKKSLPEYIGHWHRMRAVVFIKLNRGSAARKEISFAIRHSGLTLRLLVILMLSLIPGGLMADIFDVLNRFRYSLGSRKSYAMNQTKDFYERIDRQQTYTVETCSNEHPFFGPLKEFMEKWHLREKKCLEIGSSKGLFQALVDDYTGVDIAESLRSCYHKPYIVLKDALLPFPDGHFDGIFTYATHEHIPDIETALTEIIRVLKPGGVCLFAPAWHTRSWFAQGYAVRQYAELTLREKLIKFSIPFRDLFLVRWPIVFLRRLFRLLLYVITFYNIPLRYKRLHANYEKFWQSDSDACNSLDPFDIILWFRSRGIICFNHGNLLKVLCVRCLALEFQKPLK